ncbi:MAG TPA: hypothetical protein VEQ85_03510 [Lacipirellulaceae bacterium]|nr:hypothetical protein [Lacipirellulaceae bacterium]
MIVYPFERAASATLAGLLRIAESLEQVEGRFAGLFWLVAWPFRAVGRTAAWIGGLLLPASVTRSLTAATRRGASSAWALVDRFNLDGPGRWLVWLTQAVWRPAGAVIGFLFAWLVTRPYRQALWGLPAAALLLPLVGAVAWGLSWGQGDIETRYRAALADARKAGDLELVRVLDHRLEILGVDTRHSDFEAAEKLAQGGQADEAYEEMLKLAPADATGFAPAHLWILVQLLDNQVKVRDVERLPLARRHLEHLELLGFQGPDYEILKATLLAQEGDLPGAADLLAPHISRTQYAALQRMRIDLELKRPEEARRDARALRQHFVDAQRQGQPLSTEQYEFWAQAELLLANTPGWSRVVREWLAVDPKSSSARGAVALLNLQEFDSMLQSNHADPTALSQRLADAARLLENPDQLETQVTRLYGMRRDMPAVATMMDQLAQAADTPTPLLAAIGTSAAVEGNLPLARSLLRKVVEAEPQRSAAWNNLAWALSQPPEQDLEGALAAVNKALELAPAEFRFRETRGQILVAKGQWTQAVEDLEFALNGMPDFAPIHASLATAYENLGERELADMHRQQLP